MTLAGPVSDAALSRLLNIPVGRVRTLLRKLLPEGDEDSPLYSELAAVVRPDALEMAFWKEAFLAAEGKGSDKAWRRCLGRCAEQGPGTGILAMAKSPTTHTSSSRHTFSFQSSTSPLFIPSRWGHGRSGQPRGFGGGLGRGWSSRIARPFCPGRHGLGEAIIGSLDLCDEDGFSAATIVRLTLPPSRSLTTVPAGVLRTVYARRVFLAKIGASATTKKPSKY